MKDKLISDTLKMCTLIILIKEYFILYISKNLFNYYIHYTLLFIESVSEKNMFANATECVNLLIINKFILT